MVVVPLVLVVMAVALVALAQHLVADLVVQLVQ